MLYQPKKAPLLVFVFALKIITTEVKILKKVNVLHRVLAAFFIRMSHHGIFVVASEIDNLKNL